MLNGGGSEPMADILGATSGAEVILFSDGYPFPAPCLRAAEEKLAAYLEKDPLCLGPPPQSKGVEPGHQSFDDRIWLRLRI